jgi:pimeloyl-ACP methyl ester carboxylesterase
VGEPGRRARRLAGVEFRTISGGGQPHVVSQAGDGPDIVLLHGFPDTPYSWREIQSGSSPPAGA